MNVPFELLIAEQLGPGSPRVGSQEVTAPIEEMLLNLEPINMHNVSYAFVRTANPEWVAWFSSDRLGGGVHSWLRAYSEHRGWPGFHVSTRTNRSRSYAVGLWHSTGKPGGQREVLVEKDAGRWSFTATGTAAPWENLDRYRARLVRDRLTPAGVEDYARHLGLRIFDEDFYTGPATIARTVVPPGSDDPTVMTLSQAQTFLGIKV